MASAAFERWRSEGRRFRHRGYDVFYREEGDAGRPALLAIHGFPSASWDWWPIWPALVARFRVLTADLIGFGWSDKPVGYRYSILDQATLLENLARERGLTEAHVLAHDYGDTVAQELLARSERRRERGDGGLRIHSVCFLNGGLFPEAHRATRAQKLLRTPLGPVLARLFTRARLASSLREIFGPDTPPSEELVDELWTLMLHADGRRATPRLLGYIDERREYRERWVGALVRARVPLRFVNGVLDPVSGGHMLERYREIVPEPDAVALDRVGHYPQIEDPAAVLGAFMEFHDRLSVRP
ncbi:MAG: alpha/beta hydrolase [Polyangiaceae bacterium]